jgi:uroporphyrin-III C-methyltransferase/precorrin-2 dehydrogenase/sirohydrochlorin ferrochelatase
MRVFPIMMRLQGRACLVVGEGAVASRKAEVLCRAGGRVTIIAPEPGRELRQLLATNLVTHHPRSFVPTDLDDVAVVIAAAGDPEVNRAVFAAAEARNIPINVVDAPNLCSFLMPAIVERAPVVIAISTGGASPVLARRLRAWLEAAIPARYGRLAEMAGRFRRRAAAKLPNVDARRRFWDNLFEGPFADLVHAGRDHEAERLLAAALEDLPNDAAIIGGIIHLVDAGPGDPELLTIKALRVLQQADVILYDRLVSKAVLDLARRDAEKIPIGNRCRGSGLLQNGKLLIDLARQGKRVVHLKGCDPLIFSPGGEQIEAFAKAGLTFEIVPGITTTFGGATEHEGRIFCGRAGGHGEFCHGCDG